MPPRCVMSCGGIFLLFDKEGIMARQVRDYFAVAVAIARRRHKSLLARFREDVIQECRLLAWEAEARRSITVKNGRKRKRFGNGRCMGLRSFTRACNAQLYVVRKQYYGHY